MKEYTITIVNNFYEFQKNKEGIDSSATNSEVQLSETTISHSENDHSDSFDNVLSSGSSEITENTLETTSLEDISSNDMMAGNPMGAAEDDEDQHEWQDPGEELIQEAMEASVLAARAELLAAQTAGVGRQRPSA